MESIIKIPNNSEFPLQNLPYGVFVQKGEPHSNAKICTRVGDTVVDLSYLEQKGLFKSLLLQSKPFSYKTLNYFMGLGYEAWVQARNELKNIICNKELLPLLPEFTYDINKVELLLPADIGDYTDFYSSRNHAYNLGCILRGPDNALQANWSHLPVGYHGRASSVVVSGTNIHRPKGQVKPPTSEVPIFTESKKVDFELEVGAFVGTGNKLGERIKIEEAENKVFGLVLMNDWSARDLQGWEYIPLGPFTAKNFGTVISPWVVTLLALEEFKIETEKQTIRPLDYLYQEKPMSYDIKLDVYFKAENKSEMKIVGSNFKYLYWTIPQQLTHHSVSGCNMRPGDLLGSGTISGKEKEEFGSLMELTWNGKNTLQTNDGERTFLKDNDEIIFRAYADNGVTRIGFGECRSKILPAN